VPLVTGTRPDDIAGSLTYYFDKRQQLQRITFEGVVGDERRLVNFVTGQYKLKAEPTLGAGLYVAKWSGRPQKARLRVNPGTAAHELQFTGLAANPEFTLLQTQIR
jgi:hypothetical protein